MENNKSILFDLAIEDDKCSFPNSIADAIIDAEMEQTLLNDRFQESIDTIKSLKPECDKLDYILSASFGALSGIIDMLLVNKPGESPMGDMADKWYSERIIKFAKLNGYKGESDNLVSAIKHLECKFKIPYDQSVGGENFKELVNLTPSNHHFKSLGHNPTLFGLVISILNQFSNESSFITNGDLIILKNSDSKFELVGRNTIEKIFCGFSNWIGHLLSDVSGSSTSKGRGMGIPSPIMSWSNDIIAIKRSLNIEKSKFDEDLNNLVVKLFNEGYDLRFQTAQMIPVILTEMIVRFVYSIRRLINYYANVNKEERNFTSLWKYCNPFANPTVKRMLTVAHGTFCLMDVGDSAIRSLIAGKGSFDVCGFFLRLNIIGVGRFTISLLGEGSRGLKLRKEETNRVLIERERLITADYLEALKSLSNSNNDTNYISFINSFEKCGLYKEAFEQTVNLAKSRNVSEDKMVKTKSDIDIYFNGGSHK